MPLLGSNKKRNIRKAKLFTENLYRFYSLWLEFLKRVKKDNHSKMCPEKIKQYKMFNINIKLRPICVSQTEDTYRMLNKFYSVSNNLKPICV